MSFLKSYRKRSSKESSKPSPEPIKKASEDLLGFDLMYQLSYFSALAAAGVPRGQLFSLGSKLSCSTAGYFQEVDRLAKNMNYQYSEACRIVGESAKHPEVKSLLLRLSSALSTGESPQDFMAREAEIQAEAYANSYERKLEALKKWTDAYIAMLVSVALVIVVAAISTMIYDLGLTFVVAMVAVMIVVAIMGAWIIYRAAPKEIKTLEGADGMISQRLPRRLLFICFPLSLVIGGMAISSGMSIGMAIAAIGAVLFPIGLVSRRLDKAIGHQDTEVSTFLRALGTTASSIGTTPVEAMERMDLRAIGHLAPAVKRLYGMLKARIRPDLCWRRFVLLTGSELIRRNVKIFIDGLHYGGDAEEVGSRASFVAMKVSLLREKRKLVASTFGWLSLAMHAVLVFLLVFVIEIVNGFSTLIDNAGLADINSPQATATIATAFSYNFANLEMLRTLLIPVILILSVINAVAPKIVEGSYTHTVFFNLAITLMTGGIAIAVAPKLTGILLGVNAVTL